MDCQRCNTSNDEQAEFCKNCGLELRQIRVQPVESSVDKQTIKYLLLIMSWEYFTWIIWFTIQKVIVPKIYTTDGIANWDKANKLYEITGWAVDIISLLILISFAIIIKNRTARVSLIVFAVIRLIMLIAYRIFDS